jgi:cytochrome oxidase assembly protein ShyY1
MQELQKNQKKPMKSQETQNKITENNVPLLDNTASDMNPQETGKSEPITQVQRDSVITNQDLPNPLVRYGFTLVILATFLFVVAIYYGIINP